MALLFSIEIFAWLARISLLSLNKGNKSLKLGLLSTPYNKTVCMHPSLDVPLRSTGAYAKAGESKLQPDSKEAT